MFVVIVYVFRAKNSKGALDSLWPEELEEEVRTLYDEFNNLEVQDRPEGKIIMAETNTVFRSRCG